MYGCVVECFEMFRQLESRVNLAPVSRQLDASRRNALTFFRGTSAGPSGMSAALVPGRILLDAPSLKLLAPRLPRSLDVGPEGD
jgi:hypothetical protein